MAFWPGEQERIALWYAQYGARAAKRVQIELAMMAPPGPAIAAQANFQSLIDCFAEWKQPPWEEIPDSKVTVNQNVFN